VDTDLSGYPTLPGGGTNLSNTNLSGGYFGGANLTRSSLSNSNFKGADFNHANPSGADLSNSNFKGANFTGANLAGATLTRSQLMGVIWSSTICPDGTNSTADGGTCSGHL
jgi:uncharacterized protein YjbI with pentapeptide repeats